MAAALAAQRADGHHCRILAAAVSDMVVHGREGDLDAYLLADTIFHRMLLEASGNEMLRALDGVVEEVLSGRTHHGMMPRAPIPKPSRCTTRPPAPYASATPRQRGQVGHRPVAAVPGLPVPDEPRLRPVAVALALGNGRRGGQVQPPRREYLLALPLPVIHHQLAEARPVRGTGPAVAPPTQVPAVSLSSVADFAPTGSNSAVRGYAQYSASDANWARPR